MAIEVQPFEPFGAEFDDLRAEAAHNYRFIEKLVRRWDDGSDRFALHGETFLAAFEGKTLLGVGGLNRDPYLNDGTGRIRHVYERENARGRGVGRIIVEALIAEAKGQFPRVRLRAGDEVSVLFYDTLGFHRTREDGATHFSELRG